MINLFEHQNKEFLPDSFDELEDFLDEIWKNREVSDYFGKGRDISSEKQAFVELFRRTNQIKSKKYVGVIQFQGLRINLLPKIMYDSKLSYEKEQVASINDNILWWLSYCRRIKFPNYRTGMGERKGDFFEVLIYLFAKYTQELLSSSIYQAYVDVHRDLPYIKGRLDVQNYVSANLSRGNWHKISCSYDSYEMDNPFNQIVKYVCRLLLQNTTSTDNKKSLRSILFILDEVADVTAKAEDCKRINFNPMFSSFETVLDYCQLFLSHSISFPYKNDLKLFAFMLPMDYVFEDFVYGFIDKELPEIRPLPQRQKIHLDEDRRFALRPDLILEYQGREVISDTKYKMVYTNPKDTKDGISQNDLYQMLAYATRFNIQDIVLLYPSLIGKGQLRTSSLAIRDEIAAGELINIKAAQIPIIHSDILVAQSTHRVNLKDSYQDLTLKLSKRLFEVFRSD